MHNRSTSFNKTRSRSYDNVGNLTQTVDRNGRLILDKFNSIARANRSITIGIDRD
jgi:hypothetical protein